MTHHFIMDTVSQGYYRYSQHLEFKTRGHANYYTTFYFVSFEHVVWC